MASFNKVMLMGNLTRDPEIRYTPKGTAVLEIGMAMNRRYKVEEEWKEEVTFVDVTFWGRSAETITQYCKKGRSLFVEGRLQLDTWEDKASGQKKSRLRVVGDTFQFVGPREGGEGGGSSGGGSGDYGARSSSPPAARPANGGGGGSSRPPMDEPPPSYEDDEQIPF